MFEILVYKTFNSLGCIKEELPIIKSHPKHTAKNKHCSTG